MFTIETTLATGTASSTPYPSAPLGSIVTFTGRRVGVNDACAGIITAAGTTIIRPMLSDDLAPLSVSHAKSQLLAYNSGGVNSNVSNVCTVVVL